MADDFFEKNFVRDIESEAEFELQTFEDERLAMQLPDAVTQSSAVFDTLTEENQAEAVAAAAPLNMLQPVGDVRILPWRLIAYLIIEGPNGRLFSGSAFIVGPNQLITAGHNLFFHDAGNRGPARSLTVVLGRIGTSAIAILPAIAYRASREWEIQGDGTADYGAVRVEADLSRFSAFTPADFPGGRPIIQVAGYPTADSTGRQWMGQADVDQVSVRRIGYPVATVQGMSGGPVFFPGTGTAIGVHVRLDAFAIAIRLTPVVMNEINQLV